jgi:F0F1-type ATP synthase delta subunit
MRTCPARGSSWRSWKLNNQLPHLVVSTTGRYGCYADAIKPHYHYCTDRECPARREHRQLASVWVCKPTSGWWTDGHVGLEHGRYSAALFSAASKNKSLDLVNTELATLKTLIAADANLKVVFLLDPSLTRSHPHHPCAYYVVAASGLTADGDAARTCDHLVERWCLLRLRRVGVGGAQMFMVDKSIARNKKAEAVKGILGDMKMSPTTVNLFTVMAENGRLNVATKVIDMYAAQIMASKGQIPACVTSAEKLEKEQLDQLTETLKGLIGKGETLLLTQKVRSNHWSACTLCAFGSTRCLSGCPCLIVGGSIQLFAEAQSPYRTVTVTPLCGYADAEA